LVEISAKRTHLGI